MQVKINKGDRFLCKEDFSQGSVLLFKKGDVYKGTAFYSLIDIEGNKRVGWNIDVFIKHFERAPMPFYKFLAIIIFQIILFLIFLPFCLLGMTLHYCSKVLISASYLLMLKPVSAKNQYQKFWTINSCIGDITL